MIQFADRLEEGTYGLFVGAVDDHLAHTLGLPALRQGASACRHDIGADISCGSDRRRAHPAGAAEHDDAPAGQG